MELSLDELRNLRNKAFINFDLRPGYILRQAYGWIYSLKQLHQSSKKLNKLM